MGGGALFRNFALCVKHARMACVKCTESLIFMDGNLFFIF